MTQSDGLLLTDGSAAALAIRHVDAPRWVVETSLVLLGAAILSVCAQIALPLWFTPVPITGQTFAVLLIGALYGSRRGAMTILAYLGQGAAGLPVFAAGGAGAAHLLGPTGGYLWGFVVAAFVIGWLAERGWDRSFPRAVICMTIGTCIIFVCGLIQLGVLVGWAHAQALGLYPFLPGAVIKIVLAATALPAGWKFLTLLKARH